jgi:DNA-directed RNA polymerase specialized sigma24 family protein
MEAVAATAAPAEGGLDARSHVGDQEAFRSLYAPAFDEVYDYVLRVVGDLDVAAAVMGETFPKAGRAFGERGTDVAPWLLTTARACALDALRYRRDRNGDVRNALRFTGVDADRMPDFNVVFDLELVELV